MNQNKSISMRWPLAFLCGAMAAFGCLAQETISATGPARVEVRQEKGRWQLYVNHEPFFIKEAGLEFGDQEKLAAHGGEADIDAAVLRLREPATSIAVNGTTVHISFPTLYGPGYTVYYKNHLTYATRQTLTTLTGDGDVHNVTDTVPAGCPFLHCQYAVT
jgi:hypothetical protein